MNNFRITSCFVLTLTPSLLSAGQIGIENFTAAAVVQDFEGQEYINMLPVLIGADTYDADGNRLAVSGKLGQAIGRKGVALRNSLALSGAPSGYIEISLGNPARRAGLYVGFEFAWTTNVEFYNTGDDLLGMLSFSGDGRDNSFAAWQADTGLIKRIRVIDENNSDRNAIIIDDFIQEIPEPRTAFLLLLGANLSIGFLRRSFGTR